MRILDTADCCVAEIKNCRIDTQECAREPWCEKYRQATEAKLFVEGIAPPVLRPVVFR